jgi:hypothetical protein
MYIRTNEGLGQAPTPSAGRVQKRRLKIKFRNNFNDFRREVEQGIGRWTVFRSDGGQYVRSLMGRWQNDYLLKVHTSLLSNGALDGSEVGIDTNFIYKIGKPYIYQGKPGNEFVAEVIALSWGYQTAAGFGLLDFRSH